MPPLTTPGSIPTEGAMPGPAPSANVTDGGDAARRRSLEQRPGAMPVVPVALLLPLSGPDATVGDDLLDAAQLALFDAADKGFRLLPYDTGGTADGAARAAREAIGDGVRLILGPLFAGSVAAVTPVAASGSINVVAFSNDRAAAGPNTFLIGLPPEASVNRIVDYAARRGIRRFALLAPENEFGRRVQVAMRQAAGVVGGAVTAIETYPPGDAGARNMASVVRRLARYDGRRAALDAERRQLSGRNDEIARQALRRLEQLQTLGELPFDAVLVPEGGAVLRTIAPLLPFYDIDPSKVRLLGLHTWQQAGGTAALGREPALVGAWFAALPPGPRARFVARFRSVYGRAPHIISSLAYDATALAAVLARAADGPDFRAPALTASNGFAGADGIFRLLPSGEVERGLAVLEITPKDTRLLDRAPTTFERAANRETGRFTPEDSPLQR